jgi:hypothetical protein
VIILVDSGKHLTKSSILHDENPQPIRHERTLGAQRVERVKSITPSAKAKCFSCKIRNKKMMSTVTQLFKIGLEALAEQLGGQRNKRLPNWEGRSKIISVCRRHDLIYRKS